MNVPEPAQIAVSVIIPTYNSEKYVEKCLQSVIVQTLREIEIIVVDNISSDRTIELAESFLSRSNRVYKIISNPKLGVSYSRNIGLNTASGEYIYFLDSDDYLTKSNGLEIAYQLAKERDLDVVHFGFDRVDENANIISRYSRLYKYVEEVRDGKTILKDYLKGKIWFCIGNAIYRREIVQKNSITFVEGWFVGEDQEFIVKVLANSTNILSIKASLVNYVIRKDSLSKKTLELFQAVDTFERIKEYLSNRVENYDSVISIINNHKIPYLIMRAVFKSVRSGVSFDDIMEVMRKNQRYFTYLRGTKFGANLYYFSTYISAKSFLLFPRISFTVMKTFSRILVFG